ncbi:hypothetical protein GUA87_10065 [Sneathiella sp. P13V-1]|uniref:hypothetical protein n=1 Tax=Sneathiella sp. P13V-1 TaxID=2697366 RepID=UPI00187BB664|nr:hypothetical protein [Sneathiella sp. P13V-1]MBE7637189.1 hypothetical protein [Sneathiella sp. P13V-1]
MCVFDYVKFAGLLVICTIISSVSANAQPPAPSTDLIDQQVISKINDIFNKPVLRISVHSQNKRHKNIDQAEIDRLDKQWRAERKLEDQPLIASTLTNPLSSYLTQIQAASLGLYTEIFVMDAKGLNVGQSSISSDYWQGDEAKFQKTFPNGAKAYFVDEAEFDDERGIWKAQFNATVADASGSPIGAITVEFNLTELSRRAGNS